MYSLEEIKLNLELLKKKSKKGLYNLLVARYTKNLYKNFLENIPSNSRVLDIGVGDGKSLLENIDIIKSKGLKIYAVDIDKEEIALFKESIKDKDISHYFEIYDTSLEDIEDNKIPNGIEYVFFSNSYSVIPNIKDLILYIKKNINPKFVVISTTLGGIQNSVLKFIKPNLSKVTLGIEFGRYISYSDFINETKIYGFNIIHQEITHSHFLPFWGEVNIFTFILKYSNV